MRGIEPIIAVVILVAVTLVIAIGVIGWIMGWWGTFGATESLQFYPDSSIQEGTLYLHVKNTGSAAAVIYKIEISGLTTVNTGFAFTTVSASTSGTLSEVTIGPGTEGYIVVQASNAIAGANYLVKIYTRAGNVYSVTVQAK
jgi:flagellin-like protein